MSVSNKGSFSKVLEEFDKSCEESIKKCGPESDTLRNFIWDSAEIFNELLMSQKYSLTLTDIRIRELYELVVHVLYLSLSGLYRNVFHIIRYVLESAVQSAYIDSRHSNCSLRTKIEILKEVEDKRDYRVLNLISKLENLGYKDDLTKEYKRLSQIIHPSYRSVIAIVSLFPEKEDSNFPFPSINCKEVSNILESLKITFDMVLFLYLWNATETKRKQLLERKELFEYCRKYNMPLLSKILKNKVKVKKSE
jgi:hypothetical protein